MSYDISLCDPVTGERLETDAPHFVQGGMYVICGTTELWLNVTYNYSDVFYRLFGDKGIRSIYGKTGAESIPIFQKAIHELKDDVSSDYWACTEGNVKKVLCSLLSFAQMRPDGVWDGD